MRSAADALRSPFAIDACRRPRSPGNAGYFSTGMFSVTAATPSPPR